MKKNCYMAAIAIGIISCFCFAKCEKDKPDSNGLPPATQEGKNTFGFLLNGQPWMPKGSNGTANLSLYYDETFQNGVFNISAYRILNIQTEERQRINIYGDFIKNPERISLPNPKKIGIIFKDNTANNCEYYTSDDDVKITGGFFEIKKLDKINRIFSAEFEIHLTKSGCPNIQITQGRFDMKY